MFMDIDKDTFDSIFGFSGGEEDSEGSEESGYSFDSGDRLFGAMQLYDHGKHLSARTSGGMRERVIDRMYSFIGLILEDVDLVELDKGEDINLYEEEFLSMGFMFEDLIKYHEGKEEYERCGYFVKVRDEFFFKVKILE